VGLATAQVLPTAATTAQSVSGQFLVLAPRGAPLRTLPPAITGSGQVRLEPTLLAISAERVKQAVWRELGVSGQWQQRITLVLFPARTTNDLVTIITTRTTSGWNCRAEMPDQISPERYLRALVQVMLLELANRSARDRSAEIPAWLVEGLAYQLQSNQAAELILEPPRFSANGVSYQPLLVDTRRLSPLEKAHKALLGETPLTFEELSWPAPGQIEGPDGPRYRACAQLFTCELLALRNGPACMRDFLSALPGYLNWQLAFLQGFQPHFRRPLDVEKWWALQATEFTGRDLIQTWPFEESWHRLTAALVHSVDVFANTNELPARATVNLQTILRDWKPAEQRVALRQKAGELDALRLRLAPELVPLNQQYRQVIELALKQGEPQPAAGRLEIRRSNTAISRAQRELIRQLDLLDARLAKLRPN
jgi:hypothetical protein